MEQVEVPKQKLNQGPIRLLWILRALRALELKRTPEDEQIGPFGDLWRPWGSNLEVTVSPVAIWVGPQIKAFFVFFRLQNGASPKKQLPKSEEFLILEGGYPRPPTDLRSPPPLGNST